MCRGQVEARGHTIQDYVDEMVICYLGIDIESIDIVQVFLYSTCLFEITDPVTSSV